MRAARCILALAVLVIAVAPDAAGQAGGQRPNGHGLLAELYAVYHEEGAIEPLIAARVAEVEHRPGAASYGAPGYAALRGLWRAWESADPAQIEGALAAFSEDRTLTPSARVYAGMLHAYARRRRGDLAGAQRIIAGLGFVRDWLIVGPFENENKSGLGEAYVPELELDAPVLFDRFYRGKVRPVRWRRAPDVAFYGWIDLGGLVRPSRSACVYATTFIKSERARRASLFVGAAGAFKLFFDDIEVLADDSYRELDADRFAVPVSLAAGRLHRVTAKVCGADSPAALTLRVADEDGAPAADIAVDASEAASTAAAKALHGAQKVEQNARPRAKRQKAASERAGQKDPQGAVQAFERALAEKPTDPERMESYARYLAETSGDDPDAHRARDLAERAASAAPTVDRLLLAAELAEDRNGRRAYLDRAEAIANTTAQRRQLLLARALWLKTGPSPLLAAPVYRELAALDPDDTAAQLGLSELYSEAGLPRTALAQIERALLRHPSSVALLRAQIALLHALGRDEQAALAEERYAALRFDDAGFLQDRLQLAAARRDAAAANHWEGRLIASEPASTWARAEVAKAERALGHSDRAIESYRQALAIAPEDTGVLAALADLYGEQGDRARQLDLLKTIVRLAPQDTAMRDYLEHIEPASARQDEQYAWEPARYLPMAAASAGGATIRSLHRLTVTTVFDSGLASRFYQRVFQPLTEQEARRARSFALSYHQGRQVVILRSARLHRKDGRVDDTFQIGEGPVSDPSINMYTLERLVHIQLPELHAGDVVDLRYRVDDVSVDNDMADYFGEIEYLEDEEPCAAAEYVLIAPRNKHLYARAAGLPGVSDTTETEGDRVVRRFSAANVPAAPIEPGMPPLPELLGNIHVSSLPDWAAAGRWFWHLSKDKLDPDDDVRELARQLVHGVSDVRKQVAIIDRYAASETRYVALELGIEGLRPRRAALTLARGWGDCKDKAALIIALLRALGIDAQMVLVRSGLRGDFDMSVASLAPFDHAIAYVPALDLYLDGTADAAGSGELPALDRGARALRIEHGEGKLVRLPEPPSEETVSERDVTLRLDESGGLHFSARLSDRGAQAASVRMRYRAESTRRERAEADLAALLGPVALDGAGLQVQGADDYETPIAVRAAGKATALRDGVAWSVPMGSRLSMVAAFAELPERALPLVVGPPRTLVEKWTATLPQNARVLSRPKPAKLESPFGRYQLSVDLQGREVTVTTHLAILVPRIAPSDYQAWRDFCRAVDAGGAPRLVIAR